MIDSACWDSASQNGSQGSFQLHTDVISTFAEQSAKDAISNI